MPDGEAPEYKEGDRRIIQESECRALVPVSLATRCARPRHRLGRSDHSVRDRVYDLCEALGRRPHRFTYHDEWHRASRSFLRPGCGKQLICNLVKLELELALAECRARIQLKSASTLLPSGRAAAVCATGRSHGAWPSNLMPTRLQEWLWPQTLPITTKKVAASAALFS